MGEKIKDFLQRQSDIEADEILAQINADPEMADVYAPDEMEAAVFARIDEYEKEKAHSNLSEEDRELIELGKEYKKRKKRRKYTAVASIALAGLLFSSVTAMGGPEKVVEVVKQIISGNERTYVDSQDDRVYVVEAITEVDAVKQIEKEFGFIPVKMHYMPDGIEYQSCWIDKDLQYTNMLYQDKNNKTILYEILLNYKTGSKGRDVEDILMEEYSEKREGIEISIKHYEVKDNKEERWLLEFTENNICYFMQIYNLNQSEVEKIIDNLYFHN